MSRQTWDAADYARNASFVPELGTPALEMLAPEPGMRVLDLGCGDGKLTMKIAQAGADVVGVDSSPEMVAAASALGLDARVVDARKLPFREEFDAVFTNATLHWVRPPEKAARGVAKALRPGGRYVGEFGGHGNIAAIHTALIATAEEFGLPGPEISPWYYPSADEFAALLESTGFIIDQALLFPRPTALPTGMAGWLRTFAGAFVAEIGEDDAPEFLERVETMLKPALRDASGRWTADYVRLRFAARLPE